MKIIFDLYYLSSLFLDFLQKKLKKTKKTLDFFNKTGDNKASNKLSADARTVNFSGFFYAFLIF